MALRDLRIVYHGHNGWYVPNLINWFMFLFPSFWVATEDHDWAEADHTHLLDRENGLHTFRVPEQPAWAVLSFSP